MQNDYYYLMMEYCPDGDLRNQIRQKKDLGEKFDIRQVVDWSLQVAAALKFCHDNQVIHRDLKVISNLTFWSTGVVPKVTNPKLARSWPP